ncbi:MAG: hypothetical protein M1829_006127 [Trizodia sp. TS-e1964]|nr:MAG: hypothetical protein M1829_006127 [Trizodia sp. TS-e1964]
MLLIGLTGSIATGKSSVSRILSAAPYNIPIIDADQLARDVVQPGTPAHAQIVRLFLPSTPDLLLPATAGTSDAPLNRPLNRAALGRRVFGTSAEQIHARAQLNGIVHPAVRRAIAVRVVRLYLAGEAAVVLDVPLLYEAALDLVCGVVVVVGVRDAAVQVARLRARDGVGEEEAWGRVRSQGALGEKVQRCEEGGGVVLWNDGGREELEREVARVWERVKGPRWWALLLWMVPPLAGVMAVWCVWWNWRAGRRWAAKQSRGKGESHTVGK